MGDAGPLALEEEAATLIRQARLALRFGTTERVGERLGRALLLVGSDRRRRAAVLALRVRLDSAEGRFEEAARHAREAISLYRDLGDVPEEISVRSQFAQFLLATGNTSEALVEALGAFEAAQRIVDHAARQPVLVDCLRALAHVFLHLNRHDEALAYGERGIEIARALGDTIAEGVLLDSMGCAYGAMAYDATAAGEHDRAAELATRSIARSLEAVRLARAGGHRRYEATALANAAEGLVQIGRPEEAMALMDEWPADLEFDLGKLSSHRLDTQGTICMALGRTADAITFFEDAFRVAGTSDLALVACEHLADAYERSGDPAAALAYQKRLHALYKRNASEASQRSASVAAVYLETRETQASLDEHRAIAAALRRSNERLHRRADDLLELSHIDPLTGLANRRRMEDLLAREPFGFGIVMIDVDRFKSINDGWSHLVGDAVLEQIALAIGRCCRESDTAVRYGGDEFAILVTPGDESTTRAIAERVRVAVETFDWRRLAHGLAVSVSVGCAPIAEAGAATSLESADRRLYLAKRNGRNRVACED